MKRNEQMNDVRNLVSLASDSDSLAAFICKFAKISIEEKNYQHHNTFYLRIKIDDTVICNNAFSIKCPIIDLNFFLERLKLITDMYPDVFFVTYERGYKCKKEPVKDISDLLLVHTKIDVRLNALFIQAASDFSLV